MKIIGLIDEDFINYKLPSMVIMMPFCTFKCGSCCQNSTLAQAEKFEIENEKIIERYLNNSLTESIVFGGLEPLDSFEEIIRFLNNFRLYSDDKIVIYTGYTEEEVKEQFNEIFNFTNLIIKFGRFIPNEEKHFDAVLGVTLASPNQYAKEF